MEVGIVATLSLLITEQLLAHFTPYQFSNY